MDWYWIDKRVLLLLHDESLAAHGGGRGLRDESLLDSALARPQNLVANGDPAVADPAACYAAGLARNNPFVDGNKRTAFLALGLFLYLNGWRLQATQAAATATILAVAASEITEQELAAWITTNIRSRDAAGK